MVPLTGRFEWVWLVLWGSAYVYYLVLTLPKGVPRLMAIVPLLPFYILVPWRAPSAAERSLLSFFFLWMGFFKLIMVAYEYGPAKDPWIMSSFPRFLTGMSFSMHMSPDPLPTSSSTKKTHGSVDDGEVSYRNSQSEGQNGNGLVSRKPGARRKRSSVDRENEIPSGIERRCEEETGMPKWMRYLAYSLDWKVVLLRCLFYFVFLGFWLQQYATEAHIPTLVLYLSYSVLVYVGILLAFELPAAIAASVFKVELPAQFDMPFLATSLADFWGRRWNLLVNNLLRVSIYNPIVTAYSGRSGKKPSIQQRAIAVFSAFTVSGIMHEIIFFYMSRRSPTFEVTLFFVLNGVATILEAWFRSKKYYVPKLVGWVVTVSFVFFTAAWLFYPPLVRDGSDKKNIEDLNTFVLWVRNLVFGSLRRTVSVLLDRVIMEPSTWRFRV